ncbi:hypothetical protein DPM33_22695 [Mesorhizobium hawassense]|uniref:Uncharacterized protein n=1 Tax=Mesorhizobium hawassense TaxID=1209954 RepID=A0A330HL04_9HYPH|nr:hypothetical protein [Mesorhizobium hawassense]RAZ88358.1 hypothetical protein DPM33_22695 [Mesorhizobium hawassense]
MRKTIQLLSVASLCGCVAAAPPPLGPGGNASSNQRVDPMPISLAMEEIITAGVRQHLKNPIAAKFGTMLAGERTMSGRHEIVVCGYVDDKGSPGGNEAFIGKIYPDDGNSFELVAIDDISIGSACRMAGLAVPEPTSKP